MLKFSILLSSLVTFLILILNFSFKIYLAREFSQENLVVYYTITDIISLIVRIFIGYKDALTTIYNKTKHKLKLMRTFTVFFIWIISIVSFLILPLITHFYLVEKMENFQLSCWYIILLFLSMNAVSYYTYIFLVTKYYKLISVRDFLKGVSLIGMILFLYIYVGMAPTYKTLIIAAILSNIIVLMYLIYKQIFFLPQFSIFKVVDYKFAHFKDDTNKQFIKLTMLSSLNYFIYGLLLFAPIFVMINDASTKELANFQVVARSIYFALISVFSWPIGRFIFPEFSSLIAKKEYKLLNNIRIKFIKLLTLFGISIVFLCWYLSKIIISYIFPIEYIESYKMINILIVVLPFIMYQNFSESVIKASGYYKINLFIKLSGILIFIITYIIMKNIYTIQLSSIYSFVLGVFGIFLISLYFEINIKKGWN